MLEDRSLKYAIPMLLALMTIVFGGCSSIDCSIDNVVAMNVSLPDTVKGETLDVDLFLGGERDTSLYTNGTNITALSLPMTYGQTEDVLLFHFTDSVNVTTTDTVRIGKTNRPYTESVDCPPQFRHIITNVGFTKNRIGDITINDTEVSNDQTKQNLIIHLRSDD